MLLLEAHWADMNENIAEILENRKTRYGMIETLCADLFFMTKIYPGHALR